jgi:hypothetical protein
LGLRSTVDRTAEAGGWDCAVAAGLIATPAALKTMVVSKEKATTEFFSHTRAVRESNMCAIIHISLYRANQITRDSIDCAFDAFAALRLCTQYTRCPHYEDSFLICNHPHGSMHTMYTVFVRCCPAVAHNRSFRKGSSALQIFRQDSPWQSAGKAWSVYRGSRKETAQGKFKNDAARLVLEFDAAKNQMTVKRSGRERVSRRKISRHKNVGGRSCACPMHPSRTLAPPSVRVFRGYRPGGAT